MNREEMLKRLKAGEDPLELRIEKWQDIANGKGKDYGDSNCALCETFLASRCIKCPIQLATHKRFCLDTPYMRYQYTLHLSFACEELAFLESLRPKKKA